MEEYGFMDLITLATSVEPTREIGFTLTVIIAGLGIVLATLAVLIVVFYAFGTIVSKTQNKSSKKAKSVDDKKAEMAKASAPAVKAPAPAAPKAAEGVSGEIVAAISAAVYSMEGNSNATITSITPVRKNSPITSRNPWARAAIADNNRPF